MNESLPTVTVLIAARPQQELIKAVIASRALDYPANKLDILVARGRHPSVQRNAAIKTARGELIYFLDDDSVPGPSSLRRAVDYFTDPAVKMVGGPNGCPPDAPPLEQLFAVVLGSWLAFGPSRARYTPIGQKRQTGEKELILCNLVARREALLELGGFNEALFPNEENALMDELQKRGGKLIYDPELLVHRRPRGTMKAFAKMLVTYGRGRGEQVRLHPTIGSLPNFVPALLCLYFAALVILLGLALIMPELRRATFWLLTPVLAYVVALLAQAAALAPRFGVLKSALAVPLIVISNILYGCGIWRGLFTTFKPAEQRTVEAQVVLEPVPLQVPPDPSLHAERGLAQGPEAVR